ncbi:unnamed protein product [Thelazia callipaeda]|uniref:Cysteine-rich motor neuron 1 protein n=1 Tax=Thelazia callipaeda TaxID=103827 RepID=A0A0N5CSE4_THECL|nr:unnamed protein product [Thelazia callipaeda]
MFVFFSYLADACCASCDLKPSTELSKHEHTVCQSAGRLFVDGETWQLAPCTSCTCRVGNVLCRVVECPPTACQTPIFDEKNQCCPKCPDESDSLMIEDLMSNVGGIVCTDNNHVARVAGSTWRMDECTSCKCVLVDKETKIKCFEEKCQQLTNCRGMPLTIKGRCCPVCSDALSSGAVCSYKSSVYSVNEEWRDGPCRNCTCQPGGGTICKEQQCASCKEPIIMPGQCCPLCKGIGWRSFDEGQLKSVLLDNKDLSSSTPVPSSTSQMNAMLYGFCLTGFILIGVILFILVYKLIKQSKNSEEKKSPIHYNSSTVLLSATKAIGSTPRLYEDSSTIRDSCGDGQSEFLISSNSETSSATSSNGSSGHGLLYDTLPLNPVKKSVSRTKSMDYGIRRGLGSFKNNTFGKLGNKHGSCNV